MCKIKSSAIKIKFIEIQIHLSKCDINSQTHTTLYFLSVYKKHHTSFKIFKHIKMEDNLLIYI